MHSISHENQNVPFILQETRTNPDFELSTSEESGAEEGLRSLGFHLQGQEDFH